MHFLALMRMMTVTTAAHLQVAMNERDVILRLFKKVENPTN